MRWPGPAPPPAATSNLSANGHHKGHASVVVVREDFMLKSPAALKPEVAAPILCAGVTTYSPMKHCDVRFRYVIDMAALEHEAA